MRRNEITELFARLSRTTEGERLLQYLEEELATQDRSNRSLDGHELYRGQGQALRLESLVNLLKDSHGALSRKR